MSTAVQSNQEEAQASSRAREDERELNIALSYRLIDEGFNKGNLAVVDEIVAPDAKEHQFFGPNHPDGPEGTKLVITDLRRLFPDFTLTINDMVAEGDKVWTRGNRKRHSRGRVLGATSYR